MTFYDSLKRTGSRAKINAEIALTERNIRARQQAFGVEFYDLISRSSNKAFLTAAKDAELTEAFNDCETEVRILEDRRQAKQHELDIVTANKDRNAFKQTALERAGQWISDSSSEAKLAAEIALLDRSIKQKKEALGILIFDHLDKGGSGMLGTLNKLSQSGRDINKCVTDAKRDVDAYKATKDRKMRELYNVPS